MTSKLASELLGDNIYYEETPFVYDELFEIYLPEYGFSKIEWSEYGQIKFTF